MSMAQGFWWMAVANVAALWMSGRWNSELHWVVGAVALLALVVSWTLCCEECDE